MTSAEVAARIAAAGAAIEAELSTMPDELGSWHPGPGEWCVKEVLAHLLLSERDGFSGRIGEILAAEEPRLRATASAEPACGRSLEEMLAELRRQRARSIELVSSLRESDLDRAGVHERVGRLTVNDLLHEWVHHDRTLLKQILGNVQARVWPAMGGAQAFVS